MRTRLAIFQLWIIPDFLGTTLAYTARSGAASEGSGVVARKFGKIHNF